MAFITTARMVWAPRRKMACVRTFFPLQQPKNISALFPNRRLQAKRQTDFQGKKKVMTAAEGGGGETVACLAKRGGFDEQQENISFRKLLLSYLVKFG